MRIWLIFLLGGFLLAGYGGGYAGAGFRYASNAREMSLGGALVAESNLAFQHFSNPALLSEVKQSQFGLSYFEMSLDRSIQVFSFTKPLPPKAAVGISFFRSATDEILGKNSLNEDTEILSVSEMYGMLSFGVSFSNRFSIGINFRAILNKFIEEYDSKSIAMDFGIRLGINDKIQMGIYGKNIFGFYQWKVDTNKNGITSDYVERFPQIWSIGCRYIISKNIKILMQNDMIIPPEQELTTRFRLGAEYFYNQKAYVRVGIKQKYDVHYYKEPIKFNFSPSFGVGLPITRWSDNNVIINYSLDTGSENEGLSHLFTWVLEL